MFYLGSNPLAEFSTKNGWERCTYHKNQWKIGDGFLNDKGHNKTSYERIILPGASIFQTDSVWLNPVLYPFYNSQSWESCGPLLSYVTGRPRESILIMVESEESLLSFRMSRGRQGVLAEN